VRRVAVRPAPARHGPAGTSRQAIERIVQERVKPRASRLARARRLQRPSWTHALVVER
jgi:hypothetical protein